MDLQTMISSYVEAKIRARNERLERILVEVLRDTPPDKMWRLHVVYPPYTYDHDFDPGVASWLGDFPPGHIRR